MIFGVLFFIAGVCAVISIRKYESEIEEFKTMLHEALARNVQLADRIFVLNDEANEYESRLLKRAINDAKKNLEHENYVSDAEFTVEIKDKMISELRQEVRELSNITDICPHCDATELICGHNGRGCTHENDETEEQEEI